MASRGKNSEAAKARQAKSRELAKRYKHEASLLKQKGILTARVDARKNITKATRTKINKFRDVLEGRTVAVRAKPDIRAKYEGILEARGSFLVVPQERAKEKAKISRGLVQIDRTLLGPKGIPFGTEREVILPFKLVDMPSLVDRLQTDPTLDNLKQPDEMFAFKIDGWASKIGFPDAKEMGDYISRNYAHLFKPGMSRKVVKYLSFVRYKGAGSDRAPEGSHTYRLANKRKNKRNNKHDVERRLNKDALRKAEQRANETPAQRKARLDAQRIRSAQVRQRKFEGD